MSKRNSDETLEQYRLRLKAEKLLDKVKKGGKYFWNSSRNGTYRKEQHGE